MKPPRMKPPRLTLVIAVGTVKSHLHHIMSKLAAANRTEAVSILRRAHRAMMSIDRDTLEKHNGHEEADNLRQTFDELQDTLKAQIKAWEAGEEPTAEVAPAGEDIAADPADETPPAEEKAPVEDPMGGDDLWR